MSYPTCREKQVGPETEVCFGLCCTVCKWQQLIKYLQVNLKKMIMARLNFLISRFQMEVNMRKRFDFSVSELRYSLLEFNSRKNSLTFDKLNEMEYEWTSLKQREFTVCVTFSLPWLWKLASSLKIVCGQYNTLTEAQVAVNFPTVDSNFFILDFLLP